MITKKYVIVFDLDETIGNFSQIYRLWCLIKDYLNNQDLNKKYLFSLFDICPEIFRRDIFKLFKFIKSKKYKKICDKVMIFTNNSGPNNWVTLIQEYIHKKLNYPLFDQIIRAFKVNGKQIELCRSSYDKTYTDFINCTKLPSNTEICFIDDIHHKKMEHNNVVYINVKPYYHIFDYETITNKFYNNNKKLFNNNYISFKKYILDSTYYDDYTCYQNKTIIEKNIEYLITQKLIKEVREFLLYNKKYTVKKKIYNNKTKKI